MRCNTLFELKGGGFSTGIDNMKQSMHWAAVFVCAGAIALSAPRALAMDGAASKDELRQLFQRYFEHKDRLLRREFPPLPVFVERVTLLFENQWLGQNAEKVFDPSNDSERNGKRITKSCKDF